MKRAITILMAVLCPLALAATAGAVTITVGAVTEFESDGFEYDTVGENPGTAMGTPSVGSWYVKEVSGSNVEVYSEVGTMPSGGPGAAGGDNYLMLYKASSGNYRNITACAEMVNTAAVGTTVVAAHSLYCPSTPLDEATSIKTIFAKGTDVRYDRVNWVGFGYDAGTSVVNVSYYHYNDSAGTGGVTYMVTTDGGATNMTVAADTWLNVRHDLTVGSSLILTIDGVVSDPIPIEVDFSTYPVAAMHFLSNASSGYLGRFYIDGGDSGPPPPRIPGDANRDRKVDDKDAAILAAHWQQSGGWGDGDFNEDGFVNDKDASIMAAHWLETSEGTAVPEPGTLVLLAGALLSLLVWRRR